MTSPNKQAVDVTLPPLAERVAAAELDQAVSQAVEAGRRNVPAAERQGTPQDWELLVSPGHVVGHRIQRLGRLGYLPAMTAGVLSAWLAFTAATAGFSGVKVPDSWVRALTYDPAHMISIPGAPEKVSVKFAYLGDLKPSQGLTGQQWSDLVQAASADVRAHGLETDKYEAIPKLAAAPTVTRPAKVLTEHKDDLAKGVIALPPGPSGQYFGIVGWVDGALSIAVIAGGCGVPFGPVPGNCQHIAADGYGPVPTFVQSLNPASANK